MSASSTQPEPQTNLPVLDHKKVAELQASVPQLVEQAKDLEIADNDDYLASGALLDLLADRQDKIAKFFEEPAKQANNVHKFITSLRATLLQPLEQAEELMRGRRKTYRQEEERLRLKKEEDQRKVAKEEQEQLALLEASKMQEIGEEKAAEVILERAAMAPPPPVFVESTVPKEKGKSVRKVFKYRIVNAALIKREFLKPDEENIKTIVDKLGFDAVNIIGAGSIEVMPDETEILRRKK